MILSWWRLASLAIHQYCLFLDLSKHIPGPRNTVPSALHNLSLFWRVFIIHTNLKCRIRFKKKSRKRIFIHYTCQYYVEKLKKSISVINSYRSRSRSILSIKLKISIIDLTQDQFFRSSSR